MNDIIKKIEDAQLKAEAPEFRVGDTVKVYGKIKEGNRERIQALSGKDRAAEAKRPSLFVRDLTA